MLATILQAAQGGWCNPASWLSCRKTSLSSFLSWLQRRAVVSYELNMSFVPFWDLQSITVSFKYTSTKCSETADRMTTIAPWDASSAFFSPNSVLMSSNSPWRDVNATFALSLSAILTFYEPLLVFNEKSIIASPNEWMNSSTRGKQFEPRTVMSFRALHFKQDCIILSLVRERQWALFNPFEPAEILVARATWLFTLPWHTCFGLSLIGLRATWLWVLCL